MEKFDFVEMNETLAAQIAQWIYPEPYSIYSFDGSREAINELIDEGYYAAVSREGEPIGFFCFGKAAQIPTEEDDVYSETALDIGLGMKPEICGNGLGKNFLSAGLAFAEQNGKVRGNVFRLTVAAFNERAIQLYHAAGFETLKAVKHRNTKMRYFIMELKK